MKNPASDGPVVGLVVDERLLGALEFDAFATPFRRLTLEKPVCGIEFNLFAGCLVGVDARGLAFFGKTIGNGLKPKACRRHHKLIGSGVFRDAVTAKGLFSNGAGAQNGGEACPDQEEQDPWFSLCVLLFHIIFMGHAVAVLETR
jgi:hypothetical protein